MARESCNLDKEEAEILKPSSSSSSSSPAPPPPAAATTPPPLFLKPSQELPIERPENAKPLEQAPVENPGVAATSCKRKLEQESQLQVQFGNRCSSCRKKVGLTGFRCRCGHLFCARHRYSDTHGCSFDYKAAGKEEISKANPVIRAAKIIKI